MVKKKIFALFFAVIMFVCLVGVLSSCKENNNDNNQGSIEKPIEPETPTEPSEPEIPSEPETPSEPTEPSEPETPSEPEQPSDPDNAGDQGTHVGNLPSKPNREDSYQAK